DEMNEIETYKISDFSGPDETYLAAGTPYDLGAGVAMTSAHGGYMASGSSGAYDGGVWLWQLGIQDSTRDWATSGHAGVEDVRFSADGSYLFGVGVDTVNDIV